MTAAAKICATTAATNSLQWAPTTPKANSPAAAATAMTVWADAWPKPCRPTQRVKSPATKPPTMAGTVTGWFTPKAVKARPAHCTSQAALRH